MTEFANLASVLCTKTFPGIGPRLADRILSRFGAEGLVSRMRNKTHNEFTLVDGINEAKARALVTGYVFASSMIELARFLDSHGFQKPVAIKLYRVWGDKSLDVIKSNPYVLLAVLNWNEVDRIGLGLGSPFHPCRVIGAIEWCLYQDIEEEKHTYIDAETLQRMVCSLIGCDATTFQRGLSLAIRTSAVIEHHGVYQAPATHWFERILERFLTDNDRTGQDEGHIDLWLDNSRHKGLTSQQRAAVKNALMYRISAYCGRGGRGKTWTLKAIADGADFLLKKRRIVLAAVAAKAVKRMQTETGFPAENCKTITGLLHVEKSDALRGAMVIVDEASMLSLVDAFRLIRKLPHDTHLVLLGDHYQIPSIHAGKLFYDIIKNDAVPNVELTISKRHDQRTDAQLEKVLNGDFPVLDDYDGSDRTGLFRRLIEPVDKTADPVSVAEDEAVRLYLSLRSRGESAQIISPLRNIQYAGSSDSINRKAHVAVFKREASERFPVGTPVVWTKNLSVDDGIRLSNGSVGYVSEKFHGDRFELAVAFEDEGVVRLRWDEVREYLDYAYCLSVHRAQGSEWDNVLIVLPRSDRMIDRNMVYTALSRCRRRSIVFYHDHAFVSGKIAEPPAHERRRSLFLSKGPP